MAQEVLVVPAVPIIVDPMDRMVLDPMAVMDPMDREAMEAMAQQASVVSETTVEAPQTIVPTSVALLVRDLQEAMAPMDQMDLGPMAAMDPMDREAMDRILPVIVTIIVPPIPVHLVDRNTV